VTTRPLVVGVDSSTQSTTVEARDLQTGAVIATGTARHPATTPPVSEQDPRSWWDALIDAVTQLGDHRRDVVAISVAGQQHGMVLVDGDGLPVRPAKLWNDTTSSPQADRLVEEFGAREWAQATGSVPVAAFTITKLAWMAEHEPDSLDRTALVMLPHDYLTWRLTGEHVTDRGDASGSGWFDPVGDGTRHDLLSAATGREWTGRLPRVLGPTEAAGTITPEAAAALGLGNGVVVACGTGDNMGAALGLGLRTGDVAISLGTSGTAFVVSEQPVHDPSGHVAGFASASGDYLPLVCTLNATKVTETVARLIGSELPGLADIALGAVDDPGTVTLVPYLDGERTPNAPDAHGTLLGITNATTRQQLALAAHDGVLCGLLGGLDVIRGLGPTADGRCFLIGGGARSAAYRQRAADLTGRDVTISSIDEVVSAGAAVQAAAVVSDASLDEVMSRWGLGTGTTISPARDASAVLERYRELTSDSVGI
jgi:xylulokinase